MKSCLSIIIYQKYAKKASRKLYALDRVTPYMNVSKRKILMTAFFNLQLCYCQLIWMCLVASLTKKLADYMRDVCN